MEVQALTKTLRARLFNFISTDALKEINDLHTMIIVHVMFELTQHGFTMYLICGVGQKLLKYVVPRYYKKYFL